MKWISLRVRGVSTLGMVAAGALLVVYFAYHMVQGDHGYVALVDLRGQVAEAHATLTQLREQRERLEARADGLVNGDRDRDLVDQQARRMLNLARPNDLVLFYRGE